MLRDLLLETFSSNLPLKSAVTLIAMLAMYISDIVHQTFCLNGYVKYTSFDLTQVGRFDFSLLSKVCNNPTVFKVSELMTFAEGLCPCWFRGLACLDLTHFCDLIGRKHLGSGCEASRELQG